MMISLQKLSLIISDFQSEHRPKRIPHSKGKEKKNKYMHTHMFVHIHTHIHTMKARPFVEQ